MSKINPIPEGFHSITPHIICKNAAKAIEFYAKAFGATEVCRLPGPDGKSIMHAEIQIGSSRVMLAEENPEWNCKGPGLLGGTAVVLHMYVKDADAAFKQAVAAGAKTIMPVTDMFWGDRYGKVADPFGHEWSIATHVRDVSPEDMQKAMQEMCAGQPS